MSDGIEKSPDRDFHPQFLPQLADETFLKSFSRLTFAAGEFPQTAQVRIGVALGDEELAGPEDEAGADFDGATLDA